VQGTVRHPVLIRRIMVLTVCQGTVRHAVPVSYNGITRLCKGLWWLFFVIVIKSDVKYQSYGPDTILLQDHAMTLTFKVSTQIRSWHVVSIWWSLLCNTCKIRLQITKLWAGHDFAAKSCFDLDLQVSNPRLRMYIVHIVTSLRIKLHAPSFNSF